MLPDDDETRLRRVEEKLYDHLRVREVNRHNLGIAGNKPYATVVVAASNSVAEGADNADFRCDGTADGSTINAAVAACPAGGTVLLLEGTYTVGTAGISLTVDGVHLRGQAAGTLIRYTSGTAAAILDVSAARAGVSDLRVETAGGSPTQASVLLTGHQSFAERVWVVNSVADGLRMTGDRAHASEVWVLTPGDIGIQVQGDYCELAEFWVSSPGGVGLLLSGAARSKASHGTVDLGSDHGVVLTGCTECQVSEMVVDAFGATHDGVQITTGSDRNRVTLTVVRDYGLSRYGVNVADSTCDDNIVSLNDLRSAGATADLNDAGTGTSTEPGNWLTAGWSGGGDADTLDGQDGAYYLARANHTGTQTVATLSDHDLGAHQTLGLASDAEVATAVSDHAAAADPHTVYQKESEKGAVSGYASLDASTLVPVAELATGTADATVFLRGDRTWASLGYAEAIGNGVLTTIDVVHTLGTMAIVWSLWDIAAGTEVAPSTATIVDANTLRFTFASAPATDAYRAVVLGVAFTEPVAGNPLELIGAGNVELIGAGNLELVA
jgi:hypothetical protein